MYKYDLSRTKGGENMYKHRIIHYAIFVFIFFVLIGCSCNMAITNPLAGTQNITTPYDLKAEVKGCYNCEINSFKAYLDGVDITSLSNCDSKKCTAASYSLTAGSHKLRIEAYIYGKSVCRDGDVIEERQFNVQ